MHRALPIDSACLYANMSIEFGARVGPSRPMMITLNYSKATLRPKSPESIGGIGTGKGVRTMNKTRQIVRVRSRVST